MRVIRGVGVMRLGEGRRPGDERWWDVIYWYDWVFSDDFVNNLWEAKASVFFSTPLAAACRHFISSPSPLFSMGGDAPRQLY